MNIILNYINSRTTNDNGRCKYLMSIMQGIIELSYINICFFITINTTMFGSMFYKYLKKPTEMKININCGHRLENW